jgi:hypothetical protein
MQPIRNAADTRGDKRVTTMKTISRRIWGAVLDLFVLSVLCVLSVLVRGARADDAADWAHQQAQAQREREQAERDQKERDEWDKYQWQVHLDYQKSILNREYDDHPWARAGWTAGAEWKAGGWVLPDSATTPPKAPVARPMPAPQARLPAAPQRRPMPQNPVAFRQMALQHQAQVRQQIMQSRQQMLQGPPAAPQLIVNPFVASAGRQDFDQQIIQNPFVGPKP